MIDPTTIDNLEHHKLEELITKLTPAEQEVMEKRKHAKEFEDSTTTLYQDYQYNWYNALETAKMYREMEADNRGGKKAMFRDSDSSDWTTVPQLVLPDLVIEHMEHLFGKSWSSFNNLRYYCWYFWPQFRPTAKWYGKKKGIARKQITDEFAADLKV